MRIRAISKDSMMQTYADDMSLFKLLLPTADMAGLGVCIYFLKLQNLQLLVLVATTVAAG